MQCFRSLIACTALIGGFSFAHAAPTPTAPASAASATQAPKPDTLLATVNDQKITVADLQRAAASLPPQARQMQPNVLIPLLLNQLVDQKAIQLLAEKENLADKPDVKAAMATAADNILQNAYLEEKIAPKLSDDALKAYYDAHYASKKPEKEIHARHILVDSEAKAKAIIAQLNKGTDFAKLSAKDSSDKASGANGGDLGWFKRGDMAPEFANAVFNMKQGKVSQKPVHTQYGWHVVQILGTRTAPVPSFDQSKDQIRRELTRNEVRNVVENAVKQVKITHYDNQGKPVANPAAAQKGAH